MPGSIVGMTTTMDETNRGFCNALQTRQQHIRREKATSNICTNEALCAVTAAVYLASLGPTGLKELGEIIISKTQYAMRLLSQIRGLKTPVFKSPHFKEFTVNFDDTGKTIKEIHEKLLRRRIHGGKKIVEEFPELGETALYCTTEVHSKDDIDFLFNALEKIIGEDES
jgi:glycine dehydrogenase subunit 1